MKYAIFSDVHANLDALERVWADAASCGAEKFVCLGDVVGYGPLPAEALHRVREGASLVIAGNHDDAVSGRMSAENFIDLASDAVARHRAALTRDDLTWLKSLPYTASIEGAVLSHGDFTRPEDFNYIDSEDSARANFEATRSQLAFVGHTHVPGLFLTGQSGRVYMLPMQDFVLEDGKRYIVNVGSVGYPRESHGECHSTYVLYDSEAGTVTFRSLPFAVSSVLQRGVGPARSKKLVILLAACVAVLAAAVVGVLRFRKPPAPPAAPAPLVQKAVALSSGQKYFKVNLKLYEHSPSALVRIEFEDAGGGKLAPHEDTVKGSMKRSPKIPPQAAKATVSIYPTDRAHPPQIERFEPGG